MNGHFFSYGKHISWFLLSRNTVARLTCKLTMKKNGSSSLPSILCISRTNPCTQYQQIHDDVDNQSASKPCKHPLSCRMFSPQNNRYWYKGNVFVRTHANRMETVPALHRTVEQGLRCDLQGDLHVCQT